ncbi:long-chain fatty acid--CoA ligase [soil metagenome]
MSSTDPATVPQLIEQMFRQFATRVAFAEDGTTFAQLEQRVARMRGRLASFELAAGEAVVIAVSTSAEARVLELAVLSGGWVRVAVSTRLHPRELGSLAADCSSRLVVCDDGAVDEVRAALASATVVGLSDLNGGEPSAAGQESSTAMLIYTSGSTGPAKGAIVTQHAWVRQTQRALSQLPAIDGNDLVLAVAQLPHFGGSIALNCATAGAATQFMDRFDAAEVVRVVREKNVTILPLAATMLELLVDELGDERLPSLRAVVYGGSAISPTALERAVRALPGVLFQFYGLAEALAPLTCLSPTDHESPALRTSAGRWLPGVDHRFVDGVLEVRGEVVTPGYVNRGGPTLANGWFRAGDLAHDHDGHLYVADRADHVIMSGGYPVQPREVENVIATLDQVAEVAVVGTPHERWGQGVTAVVVLRAGASEEGLFDAIVSACRASLASYKKPVALLVVAKLPRNPAGKPNRSAILELLEN